jgi:hypothetical protein
VKRSAKLSISSSKRSKIWSNALAGLAPPNLRLNQPANDEPALADAGVMVELENDDGLKIDPKAKVISVENADGSVNIYLGGLPKPDTSEDDGWYANLVSKVDDMELGRIVDDLLRGITDDISSRKEWVEALTQGIQLLGLQVEIPGLQGASDGAPVEGMSKVRHPLLLEACLRFQANARSEMLPTDGPVKIRDDHGGNPTGAPGMGHNGGPAFEGVTVEQDQLADALELDMNHFLTSVASEYYPDTDRMFFKLGFGGMAFKKVYFSPLKERPVSETVDANDLIVNNAATDLKNAKRVTHKLMMRPSVVRRMQIIGAYRDVPLSEPSSPELNSLERQERAQQGVSADSMNPEDRDREIYECYCELNISGFEHKRNGQETGLEIPYRVTIDVSSRQVLAIVRNYDEDTKDLPEPRSTFVKYTFVPGLGFWDIGLLHILGNTTNAVTAAWREMLDNGMYANFPGFLISKQASRQNTSIMRVPPGGSAQIDTMGQDIRQMAMPLPYNTAQMPPLMALVQDMQTQGQRVGGTSELQVGEGKQDAPVGTTLALIDQATKVLNSVHKRMHAAQAEEFRLLVGCFREHPEAIVERRCASNYQWTEQTFLQALKDCDLVPQADPNTASRTERLAKLLALKQLQMGAPQLYDPVAVDTVVLQGLGFSDPTQFFVQPGTQQPTPDEQGTQAQIKAGLQEADAKTTEANAKAEIAKAKTAEIEAKVQQGAFKPKESPQGLGGAKVDPFAGVDAKAKLLDAQTRHQDLGIEAARIHADNQNQALDRKQEHDSDVMHLVAEVAKNQQAMQQAAAKTKAIEKKAGA